MFLLGVTALSLLTTPLIVLVAMNWVLAKEGPGTHNGLLPTLHSKRISGDAVDGGDDDVAVPLNGLNGTGKALRYFRAAAAAVRAGRGSDLDGDRPSAGHAAVGNGVAAEREREREREREEEP